MLTQDEHGNAELVCDECDGKGWFVDYADGWDWRHDEHTQWRVVVECGACEGRPVRVGMMHEFVGGEDVCGCAGCAGERCETTTHFLTEAA